MAGMEALGRLFNVVPVAAGVPVSLKDAAGVTFIVTGADTFTAGSAAAQDGTVSDLASVTRVWTNASTSGADPWVLAEQDAAATVTVADGAAAFYVDGEDLPAGAGYVSVSADGTGLVTAIVHDLSVQRTPGNLRVLSGAGS